MSKFAFALVFFIGWVGLYFSPPAFAETCPDPHEIRGGNIPPSWGEADNNLSYSDWFGTSSNLTYVQGFDSVEIAPNSIICKYVTKVTLQKYATAEPVHAEHWKRKGFNWTCNEGVEECEFL